MKTLLLMSILIATVAAPALAARHPLARRGLKLMLLFLLAFNALYLAYVTLVHVELFLPVRE